MALGFETSTGFNYATVARRGSSGWKVTTTGKRAHSSGVFSERTGAGAIFEIGRILNDFYEEVKGPVLLTFNPGMIVGEPSPVLTRLLEMLPHLERAMWWHRQLPFKEA